MQNLVSVSGPVRFPWAYIEPDQAFARDAVALNCRMLSLCRPLRGFCWWAGPAVRPDVCPQSAAGSAVGVVYVVISPLPPGQESLLVPLAPRGAVYTLPGWWQHFGRVPAKGILKGACPQENVGASTLLAS